MKKKQTKRKSKFNECKHKKFPVEQARNAAAEITFTMLWVNRFHARCFEKNCRWMHRKLFQWSIDPKGEIPEGYRVVSIDSLVEFAWRIHSNSPCSSGEAIIFSFAIHLVFIIKGASLLLFSSCIVSIKLFLKFCYCRPSKTSRNEPKPIWPQQQHMYYLWWLWSCYWWS